MDARRLSLADAESLAVDAARAVGVNAPQARALARATVAAEAIGRRAVGFAHLPDYLEAFLAGRIRGDAEPELSFPVPALIACDAREGIAQLGFDLAFADLTHRARAYGLAAFALSNAFTAGEVGYYPRRLAEAGLVAFAAANGPALITVPGADATPVYCTNPFAFAAPVEGRPPLLIDQSSSAAAFVELRRRALADEPLPKGWAVDSDGRPTTDARAALKGALLAFGGARGANIALMVETLAAGLTGANWSLDAPAFEAGAASPGAGLFVAAIDPQALAPRLPRRLRDQLDRLAALGVHAPGRSRTAAAFIELPAGLALRIEALAEAGRAARRSLSPLR
jgi:(2R)-3-sulfolactate dehydrogenase (NADP+)